MWDGEKLGDVMAVAIHSQWGENGVTLGDDAVGCWGAIIGSKEGVPIMGGSERWVL